jgi:hypothetical protein
MKPRVEAGKRARDSSSVSASPSALSRKRGREDRANLAFNLSAIIFQIECKIF